MDEEEGFTYASLRRLERTENTTPRLAKLEGRFWERLGQHLTRIRSAFHDQQEEDPTSRRTVVLADELRNTLRLGESIWSLREKKVVQAALASARKSDGQPYPPDNTLPEERRLYEEVLAVLKDARGEVLLQVRPAARPPVVPAVPTGTAIPPVAQGVVTGTPAATPEVLAVAQVAGRSDAEAAGAQGPGRTGIPPGPSPGAALAQEAQAHQGGVGVGGVGGQTVELRLVEAVEGVPLFTGPDLVDYRMEKGEVGNLPRRAAEILAQQGRVRMLPDEVAETAQV